MRTFAQQQSHPQKPQSSGPSRPERGYTRDHRQHLPYSVLEAEKSGGAKPYFDFSRIPIHPSAHASDTLEQEANHVSERVMRLPAAHLLPTQPLQRKAIGQASANGSLAPTSVHYALRSPSQPLDTATRAFMEPRFGYDFSHVRVHSGTAAEQSARDVNAAAYTVGHDLVFGSGRFAPITHEGQHLLAHELTHVVQQSGGASVLQRAPAGKAALPAPTMTEAEAEAWYREINLDDAFADPSPPWTAGDPLLAGESLEDSIESSLQQSLTPEEMHRQLLVRRAQPLGASAYQAAGSKATLDGMGQKIADLRSKIARRKVEIAGLKKGGPSVKGALGKAKAEMGAFEDEVKTLEKARQRLLKSSRFSQIGKGAPAGTGQITYAGIQIETAEGKRIALEFAETNTTEHAEEAMIREIESKLTKEQLRGARVTVVGDQVVCGERCVPALSKFAERNEIDSVDGIVFRRARISSSPTTLIAPQELASPRTTLRTMTESKSAGKELVKETLPIYRKPPPAGSGGSTVAHAAESAGSAEVKLIARIEREAAKDAPGFWKSMARGLAAGLKSITPAKVAKFGKNFAKEGVKGYITAKAVDWIIGDSRLEEDQAALDAGNHVPHNDLPEKIRSYEKTAISFLPPPVAIIVAGAVRSINPLSSDFLYEATTQEAKRKYDKFKEEYGSSDEAARLYDQSEKAADDFYNGITPFD